MHRINDEIARGVVPVHIELVSVFREGVSRGGGGEGILKAPEIGVHPLEGGEALDDPSVFRERCLAIKDRVCRAIARLGDRVTVRRGGWQPDAMEACVSILVVGILDPKASVA